MKIVSRMVIGAAIVTLVFLGYAWTVQGVVSNYHDNNDWANQTAEIMRTSSVLAVDFGQMESNLRSFLLTGEEAYVSALENAEAEYTADISRLEDLTISESELRVQVTGLSQALEDWKTQGLVILVSERREVTQGIIPFSRLVDRLESPDQKKLSGAIATRLDEFAEKSRRILQQRIEEAQKSDERTDTVLKFGFWIELAAILLVFFYVGRDLKRSLADLTDLSERINEVVADTSSATSQILATMEEQEAIAAQQSTSVNEVTSTIAELSANARQISGNTRTVSGQTEKSAQQILLLADRAQEVGRISSTIAEISQQINLLALNASIEAARAGDAGRGFSVVATEIRRLAENTSSASEEIFALIESIQKTTNATVLMTEEAVDGVRTIAHAIQQQEVAANQVNDSMSEINSGMSESLVGVKHTVTAIEQLNDLTSKLVERVKGLRLQ